MPFMIPTSHHAFLILALGTLIKKKQLLKVSECIDILLRLTQVTYFRIRTFKEGVGISELKVRFGIFYFIRNL